MKLKTLLAALALTMAPALATAQCFDKSEQVTMSCTEGTQWDAAAQTCVPVVTG